MKAQNHPEYDQSFPEQFNWSLLDSPKLFHVASRLAARIQSETILIPSQRHTMAGARLALNLIAETGDIS